MECTETQVESLPDDLKSFVAQNTAEQERVLQCFFLKLHVLWTVQTGVLVLTNHRLLLKSSIHFFHFYYWNNLLQADVDDEYWYIIRLSSVKKVGINKKLVYVDYGVIDKKGKYAAIGIEFTNETQADNFGNLLKKVIAEYSIAPVPIKAETRVPDIADQLEKLSELRKNQMITDEEYAAAKKKLLA
jgi:Short C-terminal domain